MSVGSGLAIIGVWVGVGLSAMYAGEAVMMVAPFAMVATAVVAAFN